MKVAQDITPSRTKLWGLLQVPRHRFQIKLKKDHRSPAPYDDLRLGVIANPHLRRWNCRNRSQDIWRIATIGTENRSQLNYASKHLAHPTRRRRRSWRTLQTASQIVSSISKAFPHVAQMRWNKLQKFRKAAACSTSNSGWDHWILRSLGRLEFTSRFQPCFVILLTNQGWLRYANKAQTLGRSLGFYNRKDWATIGKPEGTQVTLDKRPAFMEVIKKDNFRCSAIAFRKFGKHCGSESLSRPNRHCLMRFKHPAKHMDSILTRGRHRW